MTAHQENTGPGLSHDGLRGCKVLVTGAAQGIGAAVATLAAEAGGTVAIVDKAEQEGRALAARLGDGHRFHNIDVGDLGEWRGLADDIAPDWPALDLLVLNAGVMSRPRGVPMRDDPLNWIAPEHLEKNWRVNVCGVVYGLLAFLPLLRRSDRATIIVTSSVAGIGVNPFDPYYSLSKHAVTGFVRAIAPTLAAQGIRMLALAPRSVDTGMTPSDIRSMQDRVASTPVDMARAILEAGRIGKAGDIFAGSSLFDLHLHEFAPVT